MPPEENKAQDNLQQDTAPEEPAVVETPILVEKPVEPVAEETSVDIAPEPAPEPIQKPLESDKTEVIDKSVGVVPVFKDNNEEDLFLIVLHKAGHWAFPKGHPKTGESILDTAKRELYEETGIKNVKIENGKEFSEQYFFDEDNQTYKKTVQYFVGFTPDKETNTPDEFKQEIKQTKWLNYTEAVKTLTFKESRKLLDEVKKYI